MEDTIEPTIPQNNVRQARRFFVTISIVIIAILCILALWVWSNIQPPKDFPVNTVISIESGMGVSEIAASLADSHVVGSETLLYAVLIMQYDPTDIKASEYVFSEPLDVFGVAKRLTEGDFNSTLINFIHREGEQVSMVGKNAEAVLADFDLELFLDHALPFEGYLFPDTYRIPPDFTADELISLMRERYAEAMEPLRPQIDAHNLSEEQIIILASIIEREANSPESMKMVSGILQNRLDIMMPLQVDASIEYILDKPLGELTPEDLLLDSAYNTYRNFGLPPTPIGNPGLTAITAVLEPTPSEFFFYITGNDGQFYYATTFDEHRVNIERHLR